jgi:hypothetical protein
MDDSFGGYVCMNHLWWGDIQSVGYGLVGRRAARTVAGEECQKPNAMGLEDGTRYNLTVMDKSLLKELTGYTSAVGVADIPDAFKEYQM